MVTLAPRLRKTGDRHLQSAREVLGYYVHAHEDDVGHVSDFLFGDAAWAIRHVVVGLRRGLSRRRVLVPVGFVSRVDWDAGAISVALPAQFSGARPSTTPPGPSSRISRPACFATTGPRRSDRPEPAPAQPAPALPTLQAAAAGRIAIGSTSRRSTTCQSTLRKNASR